MRKRMWTMIALVSLAGCFGLSSRDSQRSAQSLAASRPATAPLHIQILGANSAAGVVHIAVYNTQRGFAGDKSAAVATVTLPADSGPLDCDLLLPGGSYAVAVLHDANSNGKCDTNLFGLPKEGVGTSNDARPKFRGPTFEESRFELPENGVNITVTLQYF